MRNVYLYGHLAKKFGRKFRFEVATPGAAIRLLNVNFEGFQRALREGSYRLIVGDRRKGGQDLSLDEVEMNLGKADFHLVPIAGGASRSKGGALKAIVGVALVGAAIFFSGGTLAAPLAGLGTAVPGLGGLVTFGNIAGIGLVTALVGVSQMISPSEQAETATESTDSFALSGPLNIQEQGYPVPVIIGEVITGGIPISAGLDIERIPVSS